jgi:hypothetical protein
MVRVAALYPLLVHVPAKIKKERKKEKVPIIPIKTKWM